MSGALFRNVAADTARLIRRNVAAEIKQLQSRPYFRSPQLLGRAKETGISLPSSPSGLCSSAKVGFVGWYLGMVKSRPVITKNNFEKIFRVLRLVENSKDGRIWSTGLGSNTSLLVQLHVNTLPKTRFDHYLQENGHGQAIYGPIMTVVFFSLNASLQGESGSDIVARLKRDVIPAMFNGVMYWPLCDFITFRFFPVHLQPLVSNSFSYLWTIYMTYMANREKPAVITAETI
ncbi:Peroxisomal membrane 22 kDa (Mpv17/PMP22) family protein [Raphanus sativus]|nr:Peroxisomal membrane 22 kDa (Mpv17/PMP22) family protein [Raphanus sativus]